MCIQINPQEITAVVNSKDNDLYGGVKLGGEKYIFIRKEETPFGWVIQLRKGGTNGACMARTKTAVIIGFYGENDQGGGCSDSVQKLAEYLFSQNI